MSKSKKILVAGGGGYIGSRLAPLLLDRGYRVIVLDRFFFGDVFDDTRNNPKLLVLKDDIRSFDKKILKGVDTVVNLAAISNDPASDLDPRLTKSINYDGAIRLARLAREMKVRKYVFSSSCSVYGASKKILTETSPLAPASLYASIKIKAEESLLKLSDKNFSTTVLRLATLYGLNTKRMRFDLIINVMTLFAWRDKKIGVFGGGEQWRPLIHIDDATRAFLVVIKEKDIKKINGQIFNVGSNEQNYQVLQVANFFTKFFPELKIEVIPDDPDKRSYNVNFDKIQEVLGFKASKKVEDGIVEIKNALEKGIVKEDIKTNTLKFYQYLREAESLLSYIRLNGRLF